MIRFRYTTSLLTFILVLFLVTGCTTDDSEDPGVSFAANRMTTGASAKSLLTAGKYDRMIFDIVYVEGQRPTDNSISHFLSYVNQRCYKPGGLEYTLSAIPDQGKEVYNTSDIVALEEAHRTRYNDGNTIAVFILVLDGASYRDQGNTVILGTAYRNTSFVVYGETISRYSSQFISDDKTVLESTVLDHEFSHLLGLVNLGADLQSDHEDSNNSNHCEVSDCLMNYQTDAGIDLSQIGFGGGIPTLDDQCLADLRALGGK